MAFNPSDNTYSLIRETAAGTLPATPAFLPFDYVQGDQPMLTSDVIESQIQRANRTSSGQRKTGFRVEGSLSTELKRDAAIDLLLESALSGTFTTNVLKAGTTDTSFSIEKRMNDGASKYYRRFSGVQVTSLTISGEASGMIEASFDLLGTTAVTGTALVTGATYANPSSTQLLDGTEVTMTINGTAVDFRSFDLSVEHDREAQDKFGSKYARGIGTSGMRKVMLSCSLYFTDFGLETTSVAGNTVPVVITIGSGANGYSITLPACDISVPADSEDGSKAMMDVDFTAKGDVTLGTDIQITRLA